MQIFTRFVRSRRVNLAAKAAFALGAALGCPDLREAKAAGPSELGVWINNEGKGAIEIKQCGAALCGNIVWLKQQLNDQGQPLIDRRNPDETKRTRPICGLPVIGNVKRTSEGWDEGWIYNPEEGAQYDVALEAAGDRLTVTGYKGIKLFSKTFTWTRAPADLQRCAGAPPADQTKAKASGLPPKLAAPQNSGTPQAKMPAAASLAAPGSAKATAPGDPKKAAVKDAKAVPGALKQPAAAVTKTGSAKAGEPNAAAAKTAAPKTAAIDKSGKPVAVAKPAAAAKKTAAAPGVPAPTAATKPAAKKAVTTTTASTASDKKPTAAAPAKKPAAKPVEKKKSADEDDAPSAVE